MPAELMQSVDVACTVDAAWDMIVDTGLQRAMMDTVLDTTLQPGSPIYYRNRNGKVVHIVGRIVAVEPPTRFSHTFRLTDRDDPPTLVTWLVEPTDSGVRITVTHTGWPDGAKSLGPVDKIWAKILQRRKLELETGDIDAGSKVVYWLMGRGSFMLPKRMRNENVQPEPLPD